MLTLGVAACPPSWGGGSGSGGTTGTGGLTESGTASTGGAAGTEGGTSEPCAANFGPSWTQTPDGECAYAPGVVLCGTDCVDLPSDAAHCDTCNTTCAGGAPCVLGRCGGVFPPPGVGPIRNADEIPNTGFAAYSGVAPGDDPCLLYLAYDIVDGSTSSVRLEVFDITDPNLTADQAHLETFDVPKSDPADLDFQGTVTVDPFTGAVGVFFYRQEAGDPCTTTFRGAVRRPGQPFQVVTVSDGSFPSTTFDPGTGGLGHYIRATRFTKPGVLFPTWSQPTPTTDPACDTCQGVRYSQAIFGAEVVP